jgi:hypothetical protein
MYVVFCNKTFGILSQPIDNFESLIWTKRWYDFGEFKLTLPSEYFETAAAATFVYNSDTADHMLISGVEIDSATHAVTVVGDALESMFDWRPMYTVHDVAAGNAEDTARGYVTRYATDTEILSMEYNYTPVTLGPDNGYTDTVTIKTVQGVLLSDAVRNIYKPLGWAYTLTRSAGTSNLVFNTVKGLDRRSTQSANQKAAFLTLKGDIASYKYSINKKDYRNFAYIYTEWTEPTPAGNALGVYDDRPVGEERRIIYYSGNVKYTLDEVDTIGVTELLKYPVSRSVSGEISPSCTLIFGTDYNLGDYCDVVIGEIGLTYSAQITAVDTVYELGTKKVYPTFGEEKFNLRKVIKREAGR